MACLLCVAPPPHCRFCDRCQAYSDMPVYRYLLSMQAQDHTGSEWLNAFGEAGDTVMVRLHAYRHDVQGCVFCVWMGAVERRASMLCPFDLIIGIVDGDPG